MLRTGFAILLLLAAGGSFGAPPPITEAEKAACEIVADHLARGPVAFAERMAATAPFAGMSQPGLLAEIEARVGPHEGSWWELRTSDASFAEHGAVFHVVFSSGVEEVVILDLEREKDRWMIRGLRSLAEGVKLPDGAMRKREGLRALIPARSEASQTSLGEFIDLRTAWLLLLAPLLSIAGAFLRQAMPKTSALILVLSLVSFLLPVISLIDPRWSDRIAGAKLQPSITAPAAAGPPPDASIMAMGSLVPVRRALASGSPVDTSSLDPVAAEVAALWIAATTVGRVPPADTRKVLEALKILGESPLASLVRARLDADAGKNEDARRHYEAVHREGPWHDALWVESLQVSPPPTAGNPNALLEKKESRDAELYYARSISRLLAGNEARARKAFQEAWSMLPMSREQMIHSVFADYLKDPGISVLVNLNRPDEQKRADFSLARSPLRTPPATRSVACGTLVRLTIGSSGLDIPGGASIAPAATEAVSGRELERAVVAEAMRSAESLNAPSLASASMQRTVESAIEGLSDHNRWQRVLDLTATITPDAENAPPSLLAWRVRALIRTGSVAEARTLATSRAFQNVMQRTPEAGALIEMAGHLAGVGAWNEAIEMMKTAGAVPEAPDVSPRLSQLALRRQLAESIPVAKTEHFIIHTTPSVPATVPERVGDLLEAELKRVSSRFGLTQFRPVRVNVLGWEDFSRELTGSDHILGFYDGEITIPFGEVVAFREGVVAILTHEMTHAVIAQATRDNAPRWFHEGLAGRMELKERQENIFDQQRGRPFMALELLDATLESGFDDAAVSDAYLIGQTFIHFLEGRYRPDSVNRLVAAFREGKNTDEAVAGVTGKSLAALDHEFREWGQTHSSAFLDPRPWPYMAFYSLSIDPRVRQGIRFSRPRPEGKKP